MTPPSDIRAADWSVRLGELGAVEQGLDDIDQCIRVIVGTPKGSVPLEPLFGCDAWLWLDAPVDVALPHVVREVYDAIAMWETRAVLDGVTLVAGDDAAHWRIRIGWHPAGGGDGQDTEVAYGQT